MMRAVLIILSLLSTIGWGLITVSIAQAYFAGTLLSGVGTIGAVFAAAVIGFETAYRFARL